MRKYVLIAEHEDGVLNIHCQNTGFEVVELVGILEVKKADLMEQVLNDINFVRQVVNENGDVVGIVEERSE